MSVDPSGRARASSLRAVRASTRGAVDPSALRAAAPPWSVNAAPRAALLTRGCLVRDCASFGLPGHVRVSPRRPDQNDRLLVAFAELTAPVIFSGLSAPETR